MHHWQQFLLNNTKNNTNTVIEENTIMRFDSLENEHQALVTKTVICDLSHLGLLQLKGSDTLSFLQGQLTNDINQLKGNNAHYTGYCNPKGRLLAFFLAFLHYDHVHLQMPKELIESITKRLKMYVMRSKVEIVDMSNSIIKIGLNGDKANELLKSIFTKIPEKDYTLISLENGAVLKLPGSTHRYEIFTDSINAPLIWNALSADSVPVGAECWELLEIRAGIPDIKLKTQEEFVPQMLNLDALDAINYKKGCYTGQEIVARTHYLGKVKRRTQLAHIQSLKSPEIGDDICDDKNQAIGKIVRTAPAIDNGFDVLVECRLESLQENKIYWNNLPLTIKTLPYSLAES